MVVTLKGHNWPTFKALGPRLLTVTDISSGVLSCPALIKMKRFKTANRQCDTKKGPSCNLWCQRLQLNNPRAGKPLIHAQTLMRVILGRVDSHSWRAAVRKSSISCVIWVPTSPVWSQCTLSRNPQLLACLGITVVSKMWAAHNLVILHSTLTSYQSLPLHLDLCWIARFISNYNQPCISLSAFRCK